MCGGESYTCVNTRSVALAVPSPPPPRLDARASISSKKIIVGAAALARLKSACIARSDSPSHLLNSSGPMERGGDGYGETPRGK